MAETLFHLNVTVNLPNEEREWTVGDMPIEDLLNAIDGIVDGNYDATSFMFTVVKIK